MTADIKPIPKKQPELGSSPTFDLEASIRYCESLARARRHNFPVASVFVPSALRPHIWSVYAFARIADDIVDEPGASGDRERQLDQWEDQLTKAYFGEPPSHPVLVALMDTVRIFELPITEFRAILSGLRNELTKSGFATYQELRQHSDLVGASLVRLLLYLGGAQDESLVRHARDLGEAIAHTRWWQDLSNKRSRVYIPSDDLHYFGFSDRDAIGGAQATRLVEFLAARTRAALVRSKSLVDKIGPELGIELGLFWWGTERMLQKIEQSGRDMLISRPTLGPADKAYVVTKALGWRGRQGVKWRLSRHIPSW